MKYLKLKDNPKQALFLIVLFGLILRLIFFSGMGISDSLAYSKAANDLNTGNGIDPDSTLTLSTRLGMTSITALSYKLFGINDFSAILFVLLTSLASIILIFYFGRLLFNDKVGMIAAFLLSIFPMNVVYATKLTSDLPSAFFMSLGVYIFLYCEKKSTQSYSKYFLSGILIGIAYLIRESALLIALFFIAYILWKRKIKLTYFLVPLGVLTILILESVFFFQLTGDLFYRTNASQDYLVAANELHNYFGRLDFPTGLLHYPYIILTSPLLSLFYILIGAATIYLIYNKRNNMHEIYLWFFVLLLYLSFGSASFSQYIPFRAVDRYLSIITIPGLLILSLAFSDKKLLKKEMFSTLLIGILIISSIGTVYLRDDRNLLDSLDEIYPSLLPIKKPIYSDSRTIAALEYISDYTLPNNFHSYPDDFEKGFYVVHNKEMIKNLREANSKAKFPEELDNNDWLEVKKIDELILFQIK